MLYKCLNEAVGPQGIASGGSPVLSGEFFFGKICDNRKIETKHQAGYVPVVPQDSKTTLSANSRSKETYGYAQQGIELLGQTLDFDVQNIRSLNLSFSQFDEMMGKLVQHGSRYPVIKAIDD